MKISRLFFVLVAACAFSTSARADICTSDSELNDLAQCYVNAVDPCRTAATGCDFDAYAVTVHDPVSNMINICCVEGNTDEQWDDCFIARMREIRKAKALPLEFRRHIRQTILSYINNPELECTEH